MWIWFGLAGVGLAAGVLGGMFGLGGGIFLVPALTLIFGLPLRVAVGASLVGIIATSAGVAVISRAGRGPHIGIAMRLEAASTTGALIGGLAAGIIPAHILALVFAVVTLATAVYTYLKSRQRPGPASEAAIESLFQEDFAVTHWPAGLGFSGLAGLLSGLVGTGGGFIKVPVMHSLMGVPLGVATATSNFMVGITAVTSAFVYYARGDIYPLVAAPTAMGVFAGAMIGARLAGRFRVSTLRLLLVILLVLLAAQMAWKGLMGG
jgi:uncharacterized membrane protein YfcA